MRENQSRQQMKEKGTHGNMVHGAYESAGKLWALPEIWDEKWTSSTLLCHGLDEPIDVLPGNGALLLNSQRMHVRLPNKNAPLHDV